MSGVVSLWGWWSQSEFIRATDQARAIAGGVFLLTMATVVMWLTVRIGKGLRHRKLFMVMSCLFASSGAARIAIMLSAGHDWPDWLLSAMRLLLPGALVLLSLFMFGSIPELLKVLRASDEVQSLRGQAKLRALVQAAPMAVVGTDCDGKVTSWNPAAEEIFGWKEKEILGHAA